MNEQNITSMRPSPDPRNWVANYADYLYAYALTRIADEEQAKDLVQETFLAGLQGLEKYAGKSSERTWLTAILKNKIVDVYRKRSTVPDRQALESADAGVLVFFNESDGHWKKEFSPQPLGLDNHDPLLHKELAQVLEKCMQKLPAMWLSVFKMKHLDDETTEFVCAELRLSTSNFWVIIHRAKLNLRACLQKNWL